MSIESSIEKMIQDAIARGDFDNLKGRGKPLDLDAYFNTPEELRMGYSVLKTGDFVPEEVTILKEIAALRIAISECADETEKQALNKSIQQKSLTLSLTLEKNRRR